MREPARLDPRGAELNRSVVSHSTRSCIVHRAFGLRLMTSQEHTCVTSIGSDRTVGHYTVAVNVSTRASLPLLLSSQCRVHDGLVPAAVVILHRAWPPAVRVGPRGLQRCGGVDAGSLGCHLCLRDAAGQRCRQAALHLLRRPALRHRPAALRPHPRRHHQGRGNALRGDDGLLGDAALRLGHARAARGVRDRPEARHPHQGGRPEDGRGGLQRRVPRHRAALRQGVGAQREAHGGGGSTSSTTTRPWTRPSWRACGGCSRSCTPRGWCTAATRSCPTPPAAPRRCPTSRPASTTKSSRTRRWSSPSPSSRTPTPRCSPGPPPPGRCRPTWRSPCTRPLRYVRLKDRKTAAHYWIAKSRVEEVYPLQEEGAGAGAAQGGRCRPSAGRRR